MKRTEHVLALLCLLGALMAACGSIEETQQNTQQVTPQETPPPAVPQPAVIPQQEPPLSFQTNTDTVATVNTPQAVQRPDSSRQAEIRYMVQIGAYQDPQNASRIQALARERYHLPVFNDYNSAVGMYQIRIGFFETKEAAYAFRQRVVNDFPTDYRDAWVVQLAR